MVFIIEEIISQCGHHRLAKLAIETPPALGSNFYSLIWSVRPVIATSGWIDHVVITRDDFQRDTDRRRWVQTLQSFDPVTGHAILKVGEGDVPRHERRPVRITYSWREWDIRNNRQVRLLKICNKPGEPEPQ